MSTQKGREITISVLKFNPRSKVSKPHFVEYKLEETPGMTLFIALMKIRENYGCRIYLLTLFVELEFVVLVVWL